MTDADMTAALLALFEQFEWSPDTDDELVIPDELRGMTRVQSMHDAGYLSTTPGLCLTIDSTEFHLLIQSRPAR